MRGPAPSRGRRGRSAPRAAASSLGTDLHGQHDHGNDRHRRQQPGCDLAQRRRHQRHDGDLQPHEGATDPAEPSAAGPPSGSHGTCCGIAHQPSTPSRFYRLEERTDRLFCPCQGDVACPGADVVGRRSRSPGAAVHASESPDHPGGPLCVRPDAGAPGDAKSPRSRATARTWSGRQPRRRWPPAARPLTRRAVIAAVVKVLEPVVCSCRSSWRRGRRRASPPLPARACPAAVVARATP